MNNFLINPDFHVGFLIGSAIYIGALFFYKLQKGGNND
jgi:hypothetical protein